MYSVSIIFLSNIYPQFIQARYQALQQASMNSKPMIQLMIKQLTTEKCLLNNNNKYFNILLYYYLWNGKFARKTKPLFISKKRKNLFDIGLGFP